MEQDMGVADKEAAAKAMAEAAGLTYWPGGDQAPADWDGGPYLCRDGGLYHMRGYGWKHGEFCTNPTSDWDRIGYRSKPAPETIPMAEDRG